MRRTTYAAILSLVVLAGCSNPQPTSEPSTTTTTSTEDAAKQLEEQVEGLPVKDRMEYFAEATEAGRAGVAQKTAPVTARLAVAGETVVSTLEGDGIETISSPAEEGDMVVRNDCGGSQEEILVSEEKFPTRYGEPQAEPDANGYRPYLPLGERMNYINVPAEEPAFAMEAPWGEMMVVKPGDVIVQIPSDTQDIYRIYGPAFSCTYEVVEPATD